MPRLNLTYEQVLGFFTGKSAEAAATHMEFLQRDLKAAGVKVATGVRKGPKPGFKRKGKKQAAVQAAAEAGAAAEAPARKAKKKKGGKRGRPKKVAAAPANGAVEAAEAEVAAPVDDTVFEAG